MSGDLLTEYASDASREGDPAEGAFTGSAGGAPCGDLVRISLAVDDGRVRDVTFGAEGCAAARAAAAATAELVEGAEVLRVAGIGSADIDEAIGGLSRLGRHAPDLAADALHRALGAAASRGMVLAPAPASGERVLVALSGGVDSAVAALLERDRGAEVATVTLKLWADRHNDGARSCCSPQAVLGARGLAHAMGLPHLTLDLTAAFRDAVVDPFVAGYAAGRTPNPCVACNGELRLDAMAALAGRLGASALATGHYARLFDDGEGPLLAAPADAAKDQTYMLSGVAPATLGRLRFPLAGLEKPQVRELAAAAGLSVATKRESQDLCFLAGEGKRAFLGRHGGLADRAGDVVDSRGRQLARHRGHHQFTIGQRRGVGVAAGRPLYVLDTDAASNRVVVGPREELARTTVRLAGVTLHRPGGRVDRVKLRYRSHPIACSLAPVPAGRHQRLDVDLEDAAYGVAPGQTACLMDGDLVVGRGTIEASPGQEAHS